MYSSLLHQWIYQTPPIIQTLQNLKWSHIILAQGSPEDRKTLIHQIYLEDFFYKSNTCGNEKWVRLDRRINAQEKRSILSNGAIFKLRGGGNLIIWIIFLLQWDKTSFDYCHYNLYLFHFMELKCVMLHHIVAAKNGLQ